MLHMANSLNVARYAARSCPAIHVMYGSMTGSRDTGSRNISQPDFWWHFLDEILCRFIQVQWSPKHGYVMQFLLTHSCQEFLLIEKCCSGFVYESEYRIKQESIC